MKPRVCIGCGEAMSETGNAFSRNPNLCASCSSLTDGREEAEASQPAPPEQAQLPSAEKPWETRQAA
jgi:hypothetical protein